MGSDRRIFLKKLVAGSAGILVTTTAFSEIFLNSPLRSNKYSIGNNKIIFPFFKYLKAYNLGNYLPKDQGGKFIQMELFNSEDDHIIVESIRNGLLQKIYGDPIGWGELEKTELEKSVWLNRFYYLPSFARLYYLSGDKSYLNDMMTLIRLWIHDNPRVTDSPISKYNWYDMQVAWRSIHLSWCFFLCSHGLTEDDKTLIFESLKEHSEVLVNGFGRQKLNEFNHQAHGALSMVYLGILFPTLPKAEELRDDGLRILEHHINNSFYKDGGNVEQMFGYYPFETSIFRDTYLLCRENEIKLPKNIKPLLQKMANYLLEVAQPDGTMPPINDSYPMPVNPTLDTVHEILDSSKLEMKVPGSHYLPDSHIGVMRTNSSEFKPWYLLANPAMTIGAHAHAGRLGFNLWYGKQPVVIDSGCCNYDDPLLVKWYRTSQAHNTVIIDGKSDEATSGDRQWAGKRQSDNRITDWIEKPDYSLVRMISPNTEKANASVNWIRNLALIKNNYLLIYDYFDTTNKHDYEILLHLPLEEFEVNNLEKTLLLKVDSPVAFIPADPSICNELKMGKGFVNINGKNKLTPVASYHITGKETHSVLMAAPVGNSASEMKISQEIFTDGIVVVAEHLSGKKDTILFRKPGSESFRYHNYKTTDWMAVY
ncbi:heparinase II/III family protein [Labilibaculum euxinus]|nr:heparinase II/III family protein [Labilibaculum euxinus]